MALFCASPRVQGCPRDGLDFRRDLFDAVGGGQAAADVTSAK